MADEQNGEESSGKKGSKLKLIIIALVALLIIGGGGGAAAYFLLGDSGEQQETAAAEQQGRQKAAYTKVRTMGGKPMFVVTLQSEGDGQPHYMQAYVEAKTRDQQVVDALTLHMPLVVSRLNNLFATQKFTQLRTVEGKQQLRSQATELVREIMMEKIGKPGIETILFTNFVMQ
ncbi:flagellar basal body-associated FliL family protein [Marinobacterium arenosum]|uniref:flagellar basal body-associated FliL family protein n=1 Tax=Marinobacterium arenosum TaxID=2862496 RepID=UPI001C98A7BA|nr:flagellar basal body-associated FliL family protein [Marinobacterium arenosum]MBY4675951.1 flagellar basal body-associated FliL family protein [Marinobacterium arenosum]